jgi:signal transduction histidine kinase/DNA-binding NarL/FixJ family response regulator
MLCEDYQGNLWIASTRQGVAKIVTNNFLNVTAKAGLEEEVVNTTCLFNNNLYLGTDKGLLVIDSKYTPVNNTLIEHLKGTRIRCLMRDNEGNLWISTYNNNKGLICYSSNGNITSYTEENGFISNSVRCSTQAEDGSILVGTNEGIAVIKDHKVIHTYSRLEGMSNTMVLTIEEGPNGEILVGTDGGGIYSIKHGSLSNLGRESGLTSDVILRIKWDEERKVYWIITSNSIQYMKNGLIFEVKNFPYSNNFDIFLDKEGNAWVLSSFGIFCVKATDMIDKNEFDYRLYDTSSGLSGAVTGNSFSELDESGNLYVSERVGVDKVNIENFFQQTSEIRVLLRNVICDDKVIEPDEDGTYVLPADALRIRFNASILNYTLSNPLLRIYLEGNDDGGLTLDQKNLTSLEYTGLAYGSYILHIQIIDVGTGVIYLDSTYNIEKQPKVMEIMVVRMLLIAALALIVAMLVWRVLSGTVIRRQYKEIAAAKAEADRANNTKARFLANMSQEIRTPINTIMGMNEMVLREDATGVPKGYFLSMMNYALDIRNASESLLGLINDLLDISKIESGKMHLVEQEYDVQEALRSIVSMIRVRANEKELTFDVVVDEILPKRMYGDVGKIKQIILNLLTNAVKYTEAGGFILNVTLEERYNDIAKLKISVKDTGMGVKEEDLDKLFHAYERLDEEKNSGIQGTGLGLNISSKFAELMNGTLVCESVYGEGSEFILTINQKIVDDTPLGAFTEHDESTKKGPYVPQFIAPDADILVVDDNPMNLNVIKGLLKATKAFVTTSSSGEDAIDKIKDNHFDVVLLDHMMPGLDGVETLQIIRKTHPNLPVYALTANSTAGEEYYKSKGFNGYLSKPIDSEVLEKTIMQHLSKDMMEIPTAADVVEEPTEMPQDLSWIYQTEGIDPEEGIKNSGGISGYIFSLNLFLDTIDENAKIIQDAYKAGNIRLYTIKVHALKSSARIIGAMNLSHMAQKLEDAGNMQDKEYIDENHAAFMDEYEGFKDKLSLLREPEESDEGKEEISEEQLQEAFEALQEVVPQMDYDAVEMIVDQLHEFKLPEKEAEIIKQLSQKMKKFDWDGVEELIRRDN